MGFVILATLTALIWMCYRASSLFKIPIPALVKLLGLELPDPPRVSLHGIAADTITLHWSLPEKAGSVAKHIIQINGINVGESEKRGETSVTVTGLNADHLYNVRVIAANSQNFQAPGQLIRLRTRRKSQTVGEGAPLATGRDSSDDLPAVHALPPALEPQPPHNHHHQHSASNNNSSGSGTGNHRRTAKERKNSPASLGQQGQTGSPAEEQHSVRSLTTSLETVRQEIAETDAQLVHTEEEFKVAEAVLRAELDLLKEKKNEEDLGRQKLRAETRALEEGKRASEATRSKTEKALKNKEDEIKKMRNDSLRWDEERVAALQRVKELSKAAEESREHAQITERELQEETRETQKAILEMEEEIRAHVGNIKALEAQKEQWKAEEEAESTRIAEDEQNEIKWKERQRHLEVRYITVYNAYQVAEFDYMRSREALLNSQSRRGSTGTDPIVPPAKKAKQRRNRNRKSRTQTLSSPAGVVAPQDARFPDVSAGNMSIGQMNVPFSGGTNPSPFFNIANGTVGAPTESPGPALKASFSADLDRIGAPMSPTANSLLPSNLFAFEDSPPSPKGSASLLEDGQSRHSGIDPLGFMAPQSPMSSGSVSTSHVSSPRSSFHQFPMFPNAPSDGSPGDAERGNNISLIGSGLGQLGPGEEESISGGRRFVKLLSGGFNRQRGKTIPLDGGPLLGSLKPNESHSFPKSPHPPGLDPIGTRRRSGSYGSWTTGLEFLHGGRKKPLERTDSNNSRRSGFNHFSPSFDPIEPGKLFDTTVSPRPSSIASFDNLLPAPSSDVSAAFGWPAAPPVIEQPRNRVSLLGGHWSDFASSRPNPSRPLSRPISPNANTSTAGLSLSHLPYQSTRPATPRLNPAAPTFEALAALKEENASSAISINTDTSNTSNVSETPKDSLLSRFSALSKKGSTSKFNISSAWKDGGFFSRKSKDSDVEDGEEGAVTSATSTPLIGSGSGGGGGIGGVSPLPWKDKSGFFGRGRKNEEEEEEELKSGSGSGSGFFGAIGRRKADKEDESSAVGEKEKEKEKKEGLGIFGRKKEKESGDEN